MNTSTDASASSRLLERLYPRITTRVTLPFLLVILLIAGIGVFIATRLVAGSIEERLNNQLLDSAQAASNALVEIEIQQLATLRLMAFTEGVATALRTDDGAALADMLRPLAANAGVDSLIVFDDAGINRLELRRAFLGDQIAYVTPPELVDVAGWPGVGRVLAGSADWLGDKFVDLVEQDGAILVYTSTPVIDPATGAAAGGISLGISADTLTSRISSQSLSEVTLFTGDGAVLSSTFRATPPQDLILPPDQAAHLMAQVQAERSPIEQESIAGTSYQVLYAPLQLRSELAGLLAVALPSDFVAERIGVSRDTFTLLFSVLFVGAAVLGLLVTRSIIRPIQRMVDTTRAIRTGDLSQRVGLRTPDELGELGLSFDHMTDQLVRRNQEISALYVAQLEVTAEREAVLASINDAVIVLDPAGQMILTNATADALIDQLRPQEETYRAFLDLCQNAAALTTARMVELAGRFYNVASRMVNLPSGESIGQVVVWHDITSLIEVERIKDEMILQLSHELRTPLTAARGYVEIVQLAAQGRLDAQSSDFMNKAVYHMGTLERMVNQVIDVSAIVSNKFALDLEPYYLDQVLYNAIDALRPATVDRDLRLIENVQHSVEQEIECDPERLQQALEHVLRNACSYTLPGGQVEIQARIEGGRAVIAVLDTGVGIDADEVERVFERTYRGRSAEAGPTDARGLGLGLYLAREIIAAHHGTIVLESEPGVGTTVTIDLPVQQEH